MKKPMSRLLASVLAAIMLINCMIVTALAADARVISMNYQPHPLYPGMNGNAALFPVLRNAVSALMILTPSMRVCAA